MAYFPTLQVYLKKFNAEFGNVIVNQIKAADLENLQAKRKAEGMADSTVDQETCCSPCGYKQGLR